MKCVLKRGKNTQKKAIITIFITHNPLTDTHEEEKERMHAK